MRKPIVFLLKPSSIHGVGVFSTSKISKGANIDKDLFAPSDHRLLRKPYGYPYWLVDRFGVKCKKGFYCPKNFNRMSVGWYLNHAADCNVDVKNFIFYAKRTIKPGEELTIDYSSLK